MRYPIYILLSLGLLCSTSDHAAAQDIAPHLAAGEFGLVLRAAKNAPANVRDPILAQVASTQGSIGNPIAASQAARQIQSPMERMGAIQGARGGSAFADFDSLMQLVQTTIVPDTWEALGGPSTMAPYPQGVYVDANGTLLPCAAFSSDDAAANLRALLSRKAGDQGFADNAGWRNASQLRCVSLRRLLDEITHQKINRPQINPADADPATLHMAGLSQIKYVFLAEDDIILAGPVGGIETSKGWHRDRTSGLNPIRSDFLFTCIASAMGNQPFGCTIDPTPQGLQRAAAVSTGIQAKKIPIGKAAEQMQTALGMQRVEVFGTAGDTPMGYLMVEADRHMKQLALGQEQMPDGVKNYLNIISDTIAQGPPNQTLLRLWFTAAQRSVRADNDRKVFEIGGDPIRLSGENQRALANGQRGQVALDPRTEAFVNNFNRHWAEIRTKYPLYGSLESIFRAASVAAVLDRHAQSPQQRAILTSLITDVSSSQWHMPSPRQVESIAVLHKVRHGRTVHNVVVASGGVLVSTRETVKPKLIDYPALSSVSKPSESQPRVVQRWWWDATK